MTNLTSARRLLCALALGAGITMAHNDVPHNLNVPPGHQMFLKASATGTQNYTCMPSGWTFAGPQATLFVTVQWMGTTLQQQIATHFLSLDPSEEGAARPTWQSSADTSTVWARPTASSDNPAWVDPTAIPWLLLTATGTRNGPTGGSWLAQTKYIQRVNTTGGLMPTGTCTVGDRRFVPYTADYLFYRKAGN